MDDYLDSFQTLISDAGYIDPWTLVVKFQCSLRLGIQNQIATIPYGRLADTDPNTWYRGSTRHTLPVRPFSLCHAPPPLHHPKLPLPVPYHCLWQDYPLFHPFQSLRNLHHLLCLWESLWTLMQLGRQGPCLHENVTDAEMRIT